MNGSDVLEMKSYPPSPLPLKSTESSGEPAKSIESFGNNKKRRRAQGPYSYSLITGAS